MRAAGEAARGQFRQTVQRVREKLLVDIRQEAVMRYSLQAKERAKIRLQNDEQADYLTLEPHLAQLDVLVREKAYTQANRLAFLFTLEARGLRPLNIVQKGTVLSSFRDNAEFFSLLLQGPD